ncbi:MAG: Lrp/AsnC family transcriptional regulator [Proteobacteria bacterium]|nr:Lrp/AsnC family transcriptional regulator [Pseudomonadota bacterium]
MPGQTNKIRKERPIDTLDRIDFEIVAALAKNARLSNKELAAHVGLAQSSCLARVRRLVESGVLRGFHADVDPDAVGIGVQAMISLQTGRHTRANYHSLRDFLLALPEVVAFYHLAGRTDFLIHVATRDIKHLHEVVVQRVATRKEIQHVETSIIFEYARSELVLDCDHS